MGDYRFENLDSGINSINETLKKMSKDFHGEREIRPTLIISLSEYNRLQEKIKNLENIKKSHDHIVKEIEEIAYRKGVTADKDCPLTTLKKIFRHLMYIDDKRGK